MYIPYVLGSTECIPVEGTRYDVLIPQRIKRSVYWAGEVDFLEQIILKKHIFTLLRIYCCLPLNNEFRELCLFIFQIASIIVFIKLYQIVSIIVLGKIIYEPVLKIHLILMYPDWK